MEADLAPADDDEFKSTSFSLLPICRTSSGDRTPFAPVARSSWPMALHSPKLLLLSRSVLSPASSNAPPIPRPRFVPPPPRPRRPEDDEEEDDDASSCERFFGDFVPGDLGGIPAPSNESSGPPKRASSSSPTMDLPVDSRHMNSSNSSESFRKAPDASVLTIPNQHFPKTGLPRLVRQKKVKNLWAYLP